MAGLLDAVIKSLRVGKPSHVDIPTYGRVEARPIPAIEQAAHEYATAHGIPYKPPSRYPEFDEAQARQIAKAYESMQHTPLHPTVKRSYDALIDETMGQYNALKNTGLDFKFMKPGMPDPYARSPSLGYADLKDKGRLWVFPTEIGYGTGQQSAVNPMLKKVGRVGDNPNAVANDAFRVVHDAYGHFGPGNPFFRHKGEERAWHEHSRMYSPEALPAMTSETRGQNSWVNFGPQAEANKGASGAGTVYAEQKAGLMPPWTWADAGKYSIPGMLAAGSVFQAPQYFNPYFGQGDVAARPPKPKPGPILPPEPWQPPDWVVMQ
jgi:hypothetical protein